MNSQQFLQLNSCSSLLNICKLSSSSSFSILGVRVSVIFTEFMLSSSGFDRVYPEFK